jgi:outer membrane protein TolC
MALYRFRDAERKIGLYRDTLIPQAKTGLNVAEESYEAGKTDFLSLIDAQRLLLEFELSYERARASREQHLAEIEMLVGGNLRDGNQEEPSEE